MTDDLEKLLRDYVQEGRQDRAVARGDRARSATALDRIFNELQLHKAQDEANHRETKMAIEGLDARLDRLERKEEVTGSHNVTALNAELAERKKAATEWVRMVVGALIAFALGLVAMAVGKAK